MAEHIWFKGYRIAEIDPNIPLIILREFEDKIKRSPNAYCETTITLEKKKQ